MATPSEYVYLLRPARPEMLRTGPTDREAAAIGRHFAYLQDLCRRGVVVLAGRTLTEDEHTFGIVIFRAESSHAASALMGFDPAVAEHVMSATLAPFRIALLAPVSGAPSANAG